MKEIIDNIKNNILLIIAVVIFGLLCLVDFYNSIQLESAAVFFTGLVRNIFNFFIMYTLGLIATKKSK